MQTEYAVGTNMALVKDDMFDLDFVNLKVRPLQQSDKGADLDYLIGKSRASAARDSPWKVNTFVLGTIGTSNLE